jgi:acetylornithine deacetylase/succinyl-diaminopimelate desuccinylase-like protein
VLASGAGHDAAVVATCAPAAIVFIPCVDGISHAPSEAADVDDLVVAEELTAAVLRRADEILS